MQLVVTVEMCCANDVCCYHRCCHQVTVRKDGRMKNLQQIGLKAEEDEEEDRK